MSVVDACTFTLNPGTKIQDKRGRSTLSGCLHSLRQKRLAPLPALDEVDDRPYNGAAMRRRASVGPLAVARRGRDVVELPAEKTLA
jgi:hypothetical protein